MTETAQTTTERISTAPTPPSAPPEKRNRVFQAAAWVAIAAGTVFIVAVVFFSGYVLGKHSGHGHFRHHKHHADHGMFMPGHPRGGPGALTPAGPWVPGGPSSTGPAGAGQVPPSVAPSVAPPR